MLGKNGVTVNGALHTPSPTPVPLLSKDLITMGDTTFHFLLPFKRGRYLPVALCRRHASLSAHNRAESVSAALQAGNSVF